MFSHPVSLCQLVIVSITCFIFGSISSKYFFSSRQNNFFCNDHDETSSEKQQSSKLFCMVLTTPDTTQSKAVDGVKATWGKRCDKLVFISSQRDDSVPTIACNCSEGYNYLWGKVKAGFKWVHHQNFNHQFDWFLKADDDTYVIVENLRAQLKRHDPNKPLVLGRRISAHISEGYMAGGPGYVLSKTALKMLVEDALENQNFDKRCHRKRENGIEDVEIGMCLHLLHVSFVDTRDQDDNLETFIPHDPQESLTTRHNESFWLNIFNYYKTYGDGPKCCSDRPVSFHRLNATMMKTLDYFIYRFKLATP